MSWQPRVLVIGPGGIKGFKTLGFLSPLEDAEILTNIDTYCGISVGAIITLLIVAGYSIREIVGEAVGLDLFTEFNQITLNTSLEKNGLISNEPIRKRLSQLILSKFGIIPTLYGLYLQTGKALITGTLNITDQEAVMMGPFTHGHVSCVDAVMFSMNIPFLFYQLLHQGKVYVDGALANPYPLDYFDDNQTNILGIYMTANTSTDNQSYWLRIINALIDQRRNHIISQCSINCRHICLRTHSDDTIGIVASNEDKARMLVEGFKEGIDFVETRLGTGRIPTISKYQYPPRYH